MSDKPITLVILDTSKTARLSSFDCFTALDAKAGIEQLLTYERVEPAEVRDIVHGAIFTRGGTDLQRTAIFVGGNDAARCEAVVAKVADSFFGPFRVSVMSDPNGSNTTAAAAVRVAEARLGIAGKSVAILGATGPVGLRAAQLCARDTAEVVLTSRELARAQSLAERLSEGEGALAEFVPVQAANTDDYLAACAQSEVIIACGAAGAELLPKGALDNLPKLRLAIDLNAVPPAGLGFIPSPMTRESHGQVELWGAVAVGNYKMKIHKAAIRYLFTANDIVLNTAAIYTIAEGVEIKV